MTEAPVLERVPHSATRTTLTVVKPHGGETSIVYPAGADAVIFAFPLEQAKVVVKGIDLYFIFEDGAQIILTGFALELAAPEAPSLTFVDQPMEVADFFARLGPVDTGTDYNPTIVESVTGTAAVVEQDTNFNVSMAPSRPLAEGLGNSQTPIILAPPVELNKPVKFVIPEMASASSSSVSEATQNNPKNDNSNGPGQVIQQVKAAIYTYAEASTDGDTIVYGFGGAGGSPPTGSELGKGATKSDFYAVDHIQGTGGNDRIWVDNYKALEDGNGAKYPGHAIVIPRVSIDLGDVVSTEGTLRFTMPAGYMLVAGNGVTMIDEKTYSMAVTPEKGQIMFDMKLAYTVPSGGAQPDAAGFYDISTISMTFNGTGTDGKTIHWTTQLTVGVRNITSDADLQYTAPGSNHTVYAIPSTPGHNSVTAGAGDDTIYAGGAPDTIDGGAGIDTVSYTYSGHGVGVTLEDGDGQAQVSGGGFEYGDILTHIENLEGSDFEDKLAGNSGDNLLTGGLGNDTLIGNAGADTLVGGAGANSLVGGMGNDVYVVSSLDDVILEKPNEGIDTVLINDLPGYTLSGNIEQLIYSGKGDFHGVGDDTDNLIQGAGGADTLEGRDGSDTLVGKDGNDLLKGGAGADSLVGGDGADTLDGGTGLDTMEGGAGNDVFVIDNQGDVVHDTEGNNLGIIGALGQPGGMFDETGAAVPVAYTLSGDLHQLKYLGTSDATLVAGDPSDTLFGGTGHNSLVGTGQDSLVGNVGADTLFSTGANTMAGGAGDDVYIIDSADARIVGEGDQNSIDTVIIRGQPTVFALGDLGPGIERVIYEGTQTFMGSGDLGDNYLQGGAVASNTLIGNGGSDTLVGGAADDSLSGGDGADSMAGGAGNDVYAVDNVNDRIYEAAGAGFDTIRIVANSSDSFIPGFTMDGNTENVEMLVFTGSSDFIGQGSDAGQTLQGGSGNNVLLGMGGDDSLIGGAGGNTLLGGEGNDSILGGIGTNSIDGGVGNDLLSAAVSLRPSTLAGGSGADTLLGGAAGNFLDGGDDNDSLVGAGTLETLFGNAGDDTIDGSKGGWQLDGGDGNDSIIGGTVAGQSIFGGAGADTIYVGATTAYIDGGSGNDVYIFDANSNRTVVINDTSGIDTVQTTLAGFTLADSGQTVENLVFTDAANHTGTGNTLANVITGNDGNDSLVGSLNSDTTTGDTLVGGNGNDVLQAVGNDSLDGGTGANTLLGSSGQDTLSDSGTGSSLDGAAGNDSIIGSGTGSTLYGNLGNDTLVTSGTGTNILIGGAGNDLVRSGDGADTLYGDGAGVNSLGQDTLDGGAGNDLLFGGNGASSLYGGAGNDTLNGSDVGSTLDGGPGLDSLVGGSGNDALYAHAGETIMANAGNDTIIADSTSATIDGGSGVDQILVMGSVDGSSRQYNLEAVEGLGRVTNVENLAYGGTGAFTLTGDSAANTIWAGKDGNWLNGGLGNDSLIGGAGADTLVGAPTSAGVAEYDTLMGGAGNDVYVISSANQSVIGGTDAGSGIDTVLTTLSAYSLNGNLLGNAGIEVIRSATPDSVSGFTVVGDAGNQSIYGTKGNDSVNAGGGANDMFVNEGHSLTVGGNGTLNGTITLGTTTYDVYDVDKSFADLSNNTYITIADKAVRMSYGYTSGANVSLLTSYDITRNTEYIIFDNKVALRILQGVQLYGDQGHYPDGTPVPFSFTDYGTATGDNANDTFGNRADSNDLSTRLGDDFFGGTGNDTYYLTQTDDAAVEVSNDTAVAHGGGIDTVIVTGPDWAAKGSLSLTNNVTNFSTSGGQFIENAIVDASITSAFSLQGNGLANSLQGSAGNDTLSGLAGDDTLDGQGGANSLIGGTGNDTYILRSIADTVLEGNGSADGSLDVANIRYAVADGTTLMAGGFSTVPGGILNLANVEGIIYADASGTGASTASVNIIGSSATNLLVGSLGNDTLSGMANSGLAGDTLSGGLGNDLYILANQGDAIIGETGGIDTVQTAINFGVPLTLGQTNAITGTGTTLDLSGIENFVYTGGANVTVSGSSDSGPGGANSIATGAGNDSLIGGAGADTLAGGTGNDTYLVTNASDIVIEQANGGTADQVNSAIAAYTLAGNVENLFSVAQASDIAAWGGVTLQGNTGANSIFGTSGNDRLDGGGAGGNDTLSGGTGNDYYVLWNAGDTIFGESSGTGSSIDGTTNGTSDTVELRYDPPAGSTIYLNRSGTIYAGIENFVYRGTQNVTVQGTLSGNIANSITTGSGNDSLDGALGADTMAGGTGNDAYSVDNVGDVVIEDVGAGNDTVTTSLASYTLVANVENLTGAGSAGQTLIGNALANVITGRSYDDRLSGGATTAGVGDTLSGGFGNDTYVIQVLEDRITGETGGTADTVELWYNPGQVLTLGTVNSINGNSLDLTNIENFTYMGVGSVSVMGGTADNSIVGGAGDDCLNGGAGNDTLSGGAGNDIYVVDKSTDLILGEAANGGADTVYSSAAAYSIGDTASGSGANVEVLAWNTLTGGATSAALSFTGNSLNNTIIGSNGADTLDGGAGSDSLVGGLGYDTYIVDSASDLIYDTGGINTIVLNSPSNYTLPTSLVQNLIYNGSGNAVLAGNLGNNQITGNAGNDTLYAGMGADTLFGGAGNDLLQVSGSGSQALIAVPYSRTQALGFSSTLGQQGTAFTLSYQDLSGDNSSRINFATSWGGGLQQAGVTWSGSSLSLTMNGYKNFTWATPLKDEAPHVVTVTFDGTNAIAYIDNDQPLVLTNVATNSSATVSGGGLLVGYQSSGSAYDNILLYNRKLDDVEAGQLGSGSVVSPGLIAQYDFENGGTNLAPGANPATALNLAYGSGFANYGPANLVGGAGNDTLVGGIFNDTLEGGTGADSMSGGNGNDVYYVDNQNDYVVEGPSTSAGTADTIVLSAGPGNNLLQVGNVYNFSLQNSNFQNIEILGIDTRAGTAPPALASFSLIGNATAATNITGWVNSDTVIGGAGNDTLDAQGGNNSLDGKNGSDTYVFTPGSSDTINDTGTTGTDTLFYAGTQAVTIDLRNPNYNNTIENIWLNSGLSGTLLGNALDNRITGGSGAESMMGDAGNDTLSTGWNSGTMGDTMDGGAGNDSVVGSVWTNDLLFGRDGNDSLFGYGATAGADSLDGGIGNDYYTVNGKVRIWDAGGLDTVSTTADFDAMLQASSGAADSLTGNFRDASAVGDSNINTIVVASNVPNSVTVVGDTGNNNIYVSGVGTFGHNLDGYTGDDTVAGGWGNDTLRVDAGDLTIADRVNGSVGIDTGQLYARTGSGPVTVTLTGSQFNTIFDNTEVLDFTQSNVQVGTAASRTTFTAADIQGIVGGSTNSSLTINFDAATSGSKLQDFLDVSTSGAVQVTSITHTNANWQNMTAGQTDTATFLNSTGQTVAKLVLNAS